MAEHEILEKVYDPRAVEPRMYELWEQSGAFRSNPDADPSDPTFTIVIPPPNVTGALHLGHALNNTLQDILIRYHRMRGFNTLWQPGTDHAGIATQAVVERRIREQEDMSRHDLGRDELVRRIWQWKDEYEARIISQLKLMGCSCDWERTRFTLDEGLARAVRHQFFNLFRDGLIFRGKRLVNWDIQLQTAVSDDEVYHETVKGHFWHFKYPVIDPKPGEPAHVIIATTRPETMLGDTAVAVHPDPEAFFEKLEGQLRETIEKGSKKERSEAQAKFETLCARRASHLPALLKLRDIARDGRKLMLPLVEREIPLIADEWADPTKGSGCVKITPAHDPNDYEVGVRNQLQMINVMTVDGHIGPAEIHTPDGRMIALEHHHYEGLVFSSTGRDKVVADLEARGLLQEIEDHDVEIGHSDRSKLPIEPYLSDQWFLKTGDVADAPEPRASARANAQSSTTTHPPIAHRRPPPDLSAGATLLTWTTYGTWLPGDDRGSVSRAPRADGTQSLRNLPGEPYDNDDSQRHTAAAERMEGKPVSLSQEHAVRLLGFLEETCERHAVEPLAIAIMRDHVHVLCQGEQHGQELLQLLKGNASRQLNIEFELSKSPRWWAKSGSRRRIRGGSDLTAAIEYVKNQHDPLCVWSFDVLGGVSARIVAGARARVQVDHQESGEVVDSGEFARAEARGSGGIRLGDGTVTHGLAQAAMDAVSDGRIRVFPERYGKSYLDWLAEKRDWCISRQLWWGHRIPVWCKRDRWSSALSRDPFLRLAGISWEDTAGIEWTGRRVREDRKRYLSPQSRRITDEQGVEWLELFNCVGPEHPSGFEGELHAAHLAREEDVLDTWFSSALWPFSTLGWPEETPHLNRHYPGSVLCTSRDIITNWVARMVMFGLYSMGDVPFKHVYIHPKILDGRGETMSKSKGNGVDPVDTIHMSGADALRYTMADMTTETQDIRMPVEYVCPHCGRLTDQTAALKAEEQARKSRGQKLDRKLQPADCHRVRCTHKECATEFATQWADDQLKESLSVARETSDKFEIGRNFCNKLWNAARFAFMNLPGAPCHKLDIASLPPEDRWILARLSLTIRRYHECLANYQFAASVKELREFFWDALCDWYIELTKPRLATEPRASARANAPALEASLRSDHDPAKQILAFCLDQVLRLWHPTIPFITERLWQQLNAIVPERGLPGVVELGGFARAKARGSDTLLIRATFPPVDGYPSLEDETILATFAELQDATRGVRELRSDGHVPPREKVTVTIVVPHGHVESFKTLSHIVQHMAGIGELNVVAHAKRPPNAGSMAIRGLRIYVHDISDDEAERARTAKALAHLDKQIAGKQAKLGNERFLANAKPEIVGAERERLENLFTERQSLQDHMSEMKG